MLLEILAGIFLAAMVLNVIFCIIGDIISRLK